MRLILIASMVLAQLGLASLAAVACPPGYAACGTHYCCPR
jgi:hypothetical protein